MSEVAECVQGLRQKLWDAVEFAQSPRRPALLRARLELVAMKLKLLHIRKKMQKPGESGKVAMAGRL
ncbi:hypothetical protein AUK22_03800 [bacterium CG2_30_54_10]|nr:MAG: hypothetical protein AUK22_03800 [bacterium CG2_30_54_10]